MVSKLSRRECAILLESLLRPGACLSWQSTSLQACETRSLHAVVRAHQASSEPAEASCRKGKRSVTSAAPQGRALTCVPAPHGSLAALNRQVASRPASRMAARPRPGLRPCSAQRPFATEQQSAAAPDAVRMTAAAVQRLHDLLGAAPDNVGTALRLTVEAGGCSGFSYQFNLDAEQAEDDRVFEYGGAKLVVDSVSYDFVRGATVDYADELIKSTFEVVANPNANGSCGCGSSFAPKSI